MASHFKVHELLTSAELAELEAFAREPGRTIDECWEWMQARGYTLARSSVGTWLAAFRSQVAAERMAASGGAVTALLAAAKEGGGLAIHDAAVLQIGQLIFEATQAGGDVTPEDLGKFSLAMQRLALAKARIEDVRAEYATRQREALDAARKDAAEGGDVTTVLAKVEQLLGVKR